MQIKEQQGVTIKIILRHFRTARTCSHRRTEGVRNGKLPRARAATKTIGEQRDSTKGGHVLQVFEPTGSKACRPRV